MKTQNKEVNIDIEVTSNPYGIPTFEDFINEAKKHFEVEKNAKNKAYAFILSNNLLDEFNDFCQHTKGQNPHEQCQVQIKNQYERSIANFN